MGLDITFTHRKNVVCKKCGELVHQYDVNAAHSSGRAWYPLLERIGYYVPYEKRTEENDWYGKDMVLTREQADYLYRFTKENDVYNEYEVLGLVATAIFEGDDVVVNADW